MYYTYTNRQDKTTISFFNDNDEQTTVVTSDHPCFASINDIVMAHMADGGELDSTRLEGMLDIGTAATRRLAAWSDRFSYHGGELRYNDEPVIGLLADQIIRVIKGQSEAHANEDDMRAVVRFAEKIMGNQSMRAREHLLNWISDRKLTIDEDGNFIAYKGVVKRDDGAFLSVHTGLPNTVRVNGELVADGRVPNPVGGLIEMARHNVNDDVNVGCSQGLHAGSWDYAHNFGQGATLIVSINPADVVSVPHDCEHQKLRVCRYRVMDVIEGELDQPVYRRGAGAGANATAGWRVA